VHHAVRAIIEQINTSEFYVLRLDLLLGNLASSTLCLFIRLPCSLKINKGVFDVNINSKVMFIRLFLFLAEIPGILSLTNKFAINSSLSLSTTR
jgi:hypothetical protein